MTPQQIAERLERLADELMVDDPDTAMSLLALAAAVYEGTEAEANAALADYAARRMAAKRARLN